MNHKNTLIKRLVSSLKPSKPNLNQDKRFLVLSTTGLGDTLWATPAIRALRECFPSCYLGVMTSPTGQGVLKNNRHIDEFFTVKDPVLTRLAPLYFRLKAKKITHVFSFHTSQRAILPLAAVIGAQEVIGSYGINKGLDCLLTQALDNLGMHEIQRRLHIVAQVGAHTLDPAMEVFVSPEDEKLAELALDRLSVPSYLPLIGLHPGSKDVFKRWPITHFINLGNRLVQEVGCQILVTGNAQEKESAEYIASHIPSAVAITDLPVLALAAFFKKLRLLITNDTGPMHLGFAQKVPTLGLFVPTNPELCGPYFTPLGAALSKKPTCTPCLKKRCQEPFCLLQIGVEEVYTAALKLLYGAHVPS